METIEGLDLTQPEIAAMKAAYETALSVLNRMAGSADILKYMSIHDELKKKYEDLERVFQEAESIYRMLFAFCIVHLLYHEETGKGCEIIHALYRLKKEARLI